MIELSLGEFLRRERERKALTLEQVSAATKVSLKILQCLERDEYASLPARTFLRGFVASYARFVGLDAQEVLTRYQGFIEQKLDEQRSRSEVPRGYVFERKEIDSSRSVLWITLSTFAVVGGIAVFLLKPALKHRKRSSVDLILATPAPSATMDASATPSPGATEVPAVAVSTVASPAPTIAAIVKPSPTPPPKPSPTPKPVATPTPAPTATPALSDDPLQKNTALLSSKARYYLLFKVKKDTTFEYQVDDLKPMKIRVKAGLMLALKAIEKVHVRVQDPKEVELKFKGPSYIPFVSFPGAQVDDQGAVTYDLPK